jgi:hypothetical protein
VGEAAPIAFPQGLDKVAFVVCVTVIIINNCLNFFSKKKITV